MPLGYEFFRGESGLVGYGSTAVAGTLANGAVEGDGGVGEC